MAKKTSKAGDAIIDIVEMSMGEAQFNVLGTTPLIQNRMAEKARQQLLMPPPQRNKAERALTLKHDPIFEFRSAMYRTLRDPKPVTRLHVPNGMFARALADAALDMPGATKAQMQRLTTIADVNISLFGVPELFMAPVISSGMKRTPDIRTRAILPEWCCRVTVRYARSLIRENAIIHLFAAAGVIIGIGDYRPQKGGAHGQFKLVGEDDKDFQRIMKTQARVAQDAAIATPRCFDTDTEELLSWFQTEVVRREKQDQVEGVPGSKRKSRARRNGATAPQANIEEAVV